MENMASRVSDAVDPLPWQLACLWLASGAILPSRLANTRR